VCSGSNLDLVKSLGADAAIDYTKQNLAAGGEVYDVIFVAVDKGSFSDCMKALRTGGVYLNATVPVRTLGMRWAALTSGKTIVTGCGRSRRMMGKRSSRMMGSAAVA
jgi:NADPH:quinone reductase-like Zn-dependent oxidoreductase